MPVVVEVGCRSTLVLPLEAVARAVAALAVLA
jgi:hypothetical protein